MFKLNQMYTQIYKDKLLFSIKASVNVAMKHL